MRTIQFNYCVVCVGHMGNVTCVDTNLFERFNRMLNLSVGLSYHVIVSFTLTC